MYLILDRIRKVIFNSGLSDSSFARSINVPQATFSNMFQRRSEPKPSWLESIVEHYNVNPEWLLTGNGEMTRSKDIKIKEPVANIPILKNKIDMEEDLNLENILLIIVLMDMKIQMLT